MVSRISKIESRKEIRQMNHAGGRPPKTEIKDNLKSILKKLKGGTPGWIRKTYIEEIGENVGPHTIMKYLDELADERFLHREILSDNKLLVEKKEKKKRKRVIIFRLMK